MQLLEVPTVETAARVWISDANLHQRALHSRRITFLSQVPQFQHSAKQIQKHLSRIHWGGDAACRAAHLWPGTFHTTYTHTYNFMLNLDRMRLRLPGGAGSSSPVPFLHTIMSPLCSSSCEQEFKLHVSQIVHFWIISFFFLFTETQGCITSIYFPWWWQIVFTQINLCNTSPDLENSTSLLTLLLSASLCSGFFFVRFSLLGL